MFFSFGSSASAQQRIPNTTVTSLNGRSINFKSLFVDRIPVVVSFWSTTCKPCLEELDEFSEQWDTLQHTVHFKLIAVSVDDARSIAKVTGLVHANEWPFEAVLDSNQDLKRALNVNMIPHIFVFDAQGNLQYSHIGYNPGQLGKIISILKADRK